MSSQERRKKEKEKLTRGMTEAAWELIVRDGYENFTLKKLAEAIDYSPPILYSYFRNKEGLIQQIIADGAVRFRQEFNDRMNSLPEDPLKRIEGGLRFYIDFWTAIPEIYHLFFTSSLSPFNMIASALKDPLQAEGFSLLAGQIQDCLRAGILKKRPLAEITMILWSSLHGFTLMLIEGKISDPRLKEEWIQTAIRYWIQGVK